jgi:hypothetical protein
MRWDDAPGLNAPVALEDHAGYGIALLLEAVGQRVRVRGDIPAPVVSSSGSGQGVIVSVVGIASSRRR